MNSTLTHPLEALKVFDPQGNEVRLGSLWETRPAALIFVRHFGCLFCAEQVKELKVNRARLEAGGARIVIIGHGTPAEAATFVEQQEVEFPVFTDPSREAYCAVGLKSGLLTTYNRKTVAKALVTARHGFRQSKTAGDPLQQGGVVVVAPGGNELWRYVSDHAGDHPTVDALVQVLTVGATATPVVAA